MYLNMEHHAVNTTTTQAIMPLTLYSDGLGYLSEATLTLETSFEVASISKYGPLAPSIVHGPIEKSLDPSSTRPNPHLVPECPGV